MNWTQGRPTTEGLYWRAFQWTRGTWSREVVKIERGRLSDPDELCVAFLGTEDDARLESSMFDDCWWQGPLPVPAPPSERERQAAMEVRGWGSTTGEDDDE